jgi:hypothetical protein
MAQVLPPFGVDLSPDYVATLPFGDYLYGLLAGSPQLAAVSGAISPHSPSITLITKAGVAAMTLAAPTAGVDDFKSVEVISTTAFAHTVTATGLLATGSASVNVVTFAAFAGARVRLLAYQGLWYVTGVTGGTFS